MATHELLLLGATLLTTLGILAITWRILVRVPHDDIVDDETIANAVHRSWRELDLDRAIGKIENQADQLRQHHHDISQLLQNPQERGRFGETQLEVILRDQLPPDMFGIREQVVDGKMPDAHIKTSSGVICIDSKFPLDNYESYTEASTEEDEDRYKDKFQKDVKNQLEKIANDYVDPAQGTTEFAFAYIPSEAVYYHLVTEEYQLLSEFTKKGVQVVSPLTLGHKLELIKADVHAMEISAQAEAVLEQLDQLEARFADVEEEWDTLRRHIQNAESKADDVDRRYRELRTAFDSVETLSEDDSVNSRE